MQTNSSPPSVRFVVFGVVSLAALAVIVAYQKHRATPSRAPTVGETPVKKAQPLVVQKMPGKESQYQCQFETMGTLATVVLVAPDQQTAERWTGLAHQVIEGVNTSMSDYAHDSELSRLNRTAFRDAVETSEALFEVIERSLEASRISDGAFDISYSPFRDLWRSAAKTDRLPSAEELAQCRQKAGWQKVQIDRERRTVRFLADGMKLDLGGIAKGYAVDRAVAAMQQAGMQSGFVTLGGDMRLAGLTEDGRPWKIGVRDPRGAPLLDPDISKVALLGKLSLSDKAVSTSGDYERYFTIGGKNYSHIINPATGWPAEEVVSATIIASTATRSDALSTTVSVLGMEKGFALIEKQKDVECLLVTIRNGEYVTKQTPGFVRYYEEAPR